MSLKEKLRLSEHKGVSLDTWDFSPVLYPRNSVPHFPPIQWLENDFPLELNSKVFVATTWSTMLKKILKQPDFSG